MSEEDKCFFINTLGIKKKCFIKSTKNDEDKVYMNQAKLTQFNGFSIYIKSNHLDYFVDNILDDIKSNFILYSGNSTLTVPLEAISEKNFEKLLTSPKLLIWYCQNCIVNNHPIIKQLPLGLDYHTLYNNKNHEWGKTNESNLPKDQESLLLNIQKQSKPFKERIVKVYINFDNRNDSFGERREALKDIDKSIVFKPASRLKRTDDWKNMSKYCFVCCPAGNGIDTHRLWEALILGCVPIVKSSEFIKMYDGLPVIIVDNFKQINQSFLKNRYEEYKTDGYDFNKLRLKYWTKNL